MFTCPMCTKTFGYQSRLHYHMVTHTKEKPHKCPMCPEAFAQKSSVKKHIRIIHDGIKPTRNKNIHCTMCSYTCCSKGHLKIHVQKHSAELQFSCHLSDCGYRTKYKGALKQHVIQAHSEKRPFKCPSDGCNYKAKRRTHITGHLQVHSNDKPFACTVPGCNYTCKCKGNLKQHTSRVHSTEKPFKCSVCDFRTKSSDNLRLHRLTHTKIKRFKCEAPNCAFASHHRSDLKRHFDRKHRMNEVLCTEPRCNFRCGSIAILKVHLKTHKLPTLKCPSDFCGFRTKYNHSLLNHISRRHKDIQSSVTLMGTSVSDPKTAGTMNMLQCNFADCRFQTTFRQHFDRHVVTHKKEELGQHVCFFCCSRFSKLSLLEAHIHRHVGEKPYSCSHCSFTAVESSELKVHTRKIHQIHVIPSWKDDQVRKCCTCDKNCFSNGESVLHSMSHLQPVVVLEQLQLHVL